MSSQKQEWPINGETKNQAMARLADEYGHALVFEQRVYFRLDDSERKFAEFLRKADPGEM
jgi:hypothetical protein